MVISAVTVDLGMGPVSRKGLVLLLHISPSWTSKPRGVWPGEFTHPNSFHLALLLPGMRTGKACQRAG